ncbi:hypothetical protein EYF80_057076 [Liparis tanakae]|uniref:Uncharacterized protein n=1 Tax=Liparis tanakae TaxID=230148 RepID=A0A4Z2EW26_9TELE|nr:hypothetical protein EYF80_057076 [Liparis tanakae]
MSGSPPPTDGLRASSPQLKRRLVPGDGGGTTFDPACDLYLTPVVIARCYQPATCSGGICM